MLRFLQTHSQKSLPQNVVYTIRDWARQARTSSLTRFTVLELPDEDLAGEIVTSPKLQAYQLQRVGPRSVAVPPEAHPGDLHRALTRLGYAQKLLSGLEDLVAAASALRSRRRTSRAARPTPVARGA